MSRLNSFVLAASACVLLTSCFKDEPLNAECDIEEAYLHADVPSEVFLQPSDSLVKVTSVMQTVNFTPLRTGTDLTHLAPHFRLTPGATINPADGSVQDFSGGPVVYTVTSEDGEWNRKYQVYITAMPDDRPDEPTAGTLAYDFEKYHLETANRKYYVWSDYSDQDNWATGNPGFSIARGSAAPDEYPSAPLAEGYDGACVKLTTRSTGGFGEMAGMRLAAGNLFTGVFDTKSAISGSKGALKATHFGEGAHNKINFRPLHFSGYYQYTPGETFQDRKGNPVEGKVDEGDIYAVVFKNTDAEGNAVYLNGEDVQTNPLIVAKALAGHVTKTEGGWKKFDLDFEYIADIDPTVLSNYGYSLAVVFTSSCGGASFEGAIGSTLLVDKVSIDYVIPGKNK